jgi:hypothetical protein
MFIELDFTAKVVAVKGKLLGKEVEWIGFEMPSNSRHQNKKYLSSAATMCSRFAMVAIDTLLFIGYGYPPYPSEAE